MAFLVLSFLLPCVVQSLDVNVKRSKTLFLSFFFGFHYVINTTKKGRRPAELRHAKRLQKEEKRKF